MISGPEHLDWLRARRSIRAFEARAIDRAVLQRLLEAATTAPSSTNRQPWRFAVVTGAEQRRAITEAVRARTEAMKAVIRKSHHAEDFGSYADFFFEPLQTAAAIVIPQYREYPDLIAQLIESGGGEATATPGDMQAELCSTSAAVMALLLQAHAEGLGACWMAGPMVARDELHAMLRIRAPWQMVGAVALGYAAERPEARPRKAVDNVVEWFET